MPLERCNQLARNLVVMMFYKNHIKQNDLRHDSYLLQDETLHFQIGVTSEGS